MNIHEYIVTRDLEEELEKIAMFGLFGKKKSALQTAKSRFDKTLTSAQRQAGAQRKKLDKLQIKKEAPVQIPKVQESQARKRARQKLMELKKKKGLL